MAAVEQYEILEKIDEGATAAVFAARDHRSGETVVLKQLLAEHSEEAAVLLDQEVRVLRALDHPGVVRVLDCGRTPTGSFVVLEYVDGTNLESAIQVGALSLDCRLRIAVEIAEALAHVHARGIVHKDLKTQNILLDRDKRAKIVDFGIAQSGLEETSLGVGTVHYLSPEQIMGSPLDARSDVYAFGILLFRLVTGRFPFDADRPADVLCAHLHQAPPALASSCVDDTLHAETPAVERAFPHLNRVIARCLEKRREDRYDGAADVASDLASIRSAVATGRSPERLHAVRMARSTEGARFSFVDREAELGVLAECGRVAAAGTGRVVLVAGTTGLGKTRLVEEYLGGLSSVAQVVWARAGASGDAPAFLPLVQALKAYLARMGIDGIGPLAALWPDQAGSQRAPAADGAPPVDMVALATFLGLADAQDDQTAGGRGGRPSIRRPAGRFRTQEQLWDALVSLILRLAEQSWLVIAVEDLHWCDAESLDFLVYLARHIGAAAALMICTYRPEEVVDPRFRDLLRAFAEVPHCSHLQLEPLSRLHTGKLVAAAFPAGELGDAFVQLVFEETGGNPLILVEVLKYLQDTGVIRRTAAGLVLAERPSQLSLPKHVMDLVAARLTRLSEIERCVAGCAAVQGQSFDWRVLAPVAAISDLRLITTLTRLEEIHRMIRFENGGYAFEHAKLSEVVYRSLDAATATKYHLETAKSLAALYANAPERSGEIAKHFYAGGSYEEALDAYLAAARHAKDGFSNGAAITFYEGAIKTVRHLRLTPGVMQRLLQAQLNLAEVQELVGELDAARITLTRAREVAREIGDAKGQVTAHRKLGDLHRERGEYDKADGDFRAAADLAERYALGRELAITYNSMGETYHCRGELDLAEQYYDSALRGADNVGDVPAVAEALNNLGVLYINQTRFAEAIEHFQDCMAIAGGVGDLVQKAVSLHNLGAVYYRMEQYEQVMCYYERSLELSKIIGDVRLTGTTYNNLGVIHRIHGDYEAALELFHKSLDIHVKLSNVRMQAILLGNLGTVYEATGRHELALEHFRKAAALSSEIGAKRHLGQIYTHLGRVHRKLGDLDESENLLSEAIRLFGDGPQTGELAEAHRERGETLQAKGAAEAAAAELTRSLEICEARGLGSRAEELKLIIARLAREGE
ncbi:MAG: tetratricopeptide repeat protein [Candidatus Schekmanbacteria bacterium]|nr:tetratricopeptide repeat protein [Candidatus Schekmanbacteria bacterium]